MKDNELSRTLDHLETSPRFKPCIAAVKTLPPQLGEYCDFPLDLSPSVRKVLADRGISRLYSHQAEAFRRVREGEDLVVVTPTASGKTLCYNLPVLDTLLREPAKRAIYLFPTKALAQDQHAELQSLIEALDSGHKVHTYDGDTPSQVRSIIRKRGHIVLTNPDMLHTGILPHHTKWNVFFSTLAFVIIDEMHSYRGVFGSHMVHVIRRLLRICRHYGSAPRFLFCSATIANPEELAEKLLGRPVGVIRRSGAPTGEKKFYFVNPPVVQKEIGLRESAQSMAQWIAVQFLRKGISTILFTTSRLSVEVLTKYLKDAFRKSGPANERLIRGYRGGYLPDLRREIEKGLRAGDIKGVVSTNALELGVDIGTLETSILCGYPGSIASTWQQAGRAGRRMGQSCAMVVARSSPLDQFIVQHPDYFFGRSPEHARLNPENLSVRLSHIKCAAFELPFQKGEDFGGPDLEAILDVLAENKILSKLENRWYWAEEAYPADQVSLRTISSENFLVLDRSCGNRAVAEVDFESAPMTIYPGAIYMVESVQYRVEDLDFKNRRAFVRPETVDYFTEAISYTNIKILDVFSSEPRNREKGRAGFHEGEVHVLNHVAGFKKLKFYTMENLGYGEISLPDQEMHTTAFWITVSSEDFEEIGLSVPQLLHALAGVGYAMQHMASFLLMCEPRDLGRCIGDPYLDWFPRGRQGGMAFPGSASWPGEDASQVEGFQPTLFLYDSYPGGVGLSASLFSLRVELLEGTRSLIRRCGCKEGCPSCAGPYTELGEGTKQAAGRLLDWMISGTG
ncbi:MAG: DEAD/DEAH box helicase [bacterium]